MKYPRSIHKTLAKVFSGIFVIFCMNPAQALDDSNNQFIAAQKSNEQTLIAPYQSEVTQLAATAEKNAQAPEIQATIQQLKNHSLNTTNANKLTTDDSGQILIFISSSMPKVSLVQWMQQAQKIHAHLIMEASQN